MVGDELAGLLVGPGDVGLELLPLDPPLAATADLDRRQLSAADERVGPRRGDVEALGDVGELQEARLGHGGSLAPTPAGGRSVVHNPPLRAGEPTRARNIPAPFDGVREARWRTWSRRRRRG